MIKFSIKFLIPVCFLLIGTGLEQSFAQANNDQAAVSTELKPHSNDGIFSSAASFTYTVKNPLNVPQHGKVSCIITTEAGKKLRADSIKVNIGKGSSGSYDFNIPGLPPGFYKINFMVNVSDYDDTTRKAFGIRPDEIKSKYSKPADFEAFWKEARAELNKVPPNFKVTEIPDSGKKDRRVFLVEMQSLGNLTVRAWLTEPVTTNKNKKFIVLLGLPGYQVALSPVYTPDPDIAVLTLNIRGSGNSKDVINVRRDTYVLLNIEDKKKYVLRGAIMDCIRAVDFIYSRPELKHDNIIASGGSLGGYLAVATSGLDKRVNFCSSANAVFSDVRNLIHEVDWPINDIKKYVATRPGLTFDKVLDNLDYFDAKNFATNITCPALVGLGLVDNIAPPNHVYVLYNNIKSQKHMIVFRDLAHEIGVKYKTYEGSWMRDQFALY